MDVNWYASPDLGAYMYWLSSSSNCLEKSETPFTEWSLLLFGCFPQAIAKAIPLTEAINSTASMCLTTSYFVLELFSKSELISNMLSYDPCKIYGPNTYWRSHSLAWDMGMNARNSSVVSFLIPIVDIKWTHTQQCAYVDEYDSIPLTVIDNILALQP